MTRLTFHLILHTHWDREWYLPRAGFQARLVPAVGDVLDLLDREPEARFLLDGQTVAAEDALDVRPEWIARVAAAVGEHRLEVGPWYVLADELMPTGESLLRNLLQGTRDAEALGATLDVLYSPDAFGHPGVLPTLAAEFDISDGVVWRGLGTPTGADRDLYQWRGPDGAPMLLYHLPRQGYEIGYDLIADPVGRWPAMRQQLVDRAVTSHIAVFVGADHHAPPADAAALRDAVHALESGNFVRLSSLREYFDAARVEASEAPVIAGELRWSYGHTWTLQGTHATRARLKRQHGGAELYLSRMVEPLVALAEWHCGSDQRAVLRTVWRTLLQSQFHDTLCGCCSDLVAREQEVRLTSAGAAAREIGHSAIHALTGHDADLARDRADAAAPMLFMWNPVPRTRAAIVTAEITCFRRDILVGPPSGRQPLIGPGFRPFGLIGANGERISVQVLSVTKTQERTDASRHYPDQDEVDLVRIAFALPPTGGLAFTALRQGAPVSFSDLTGLVATDTRLENRFISILLDYERIELIDRRSGERYVDVLQLLDAADDGDSYTPWIRDERGKPAATATPPRLIASGPLVAAIEHRLTIDHPAHGHVDARMILLLHADSPVLRVRLEIDNRAVSHRLRLRVPVGAGSTATAGAAFGFERREPVTYSASKFPAEQPVRTAPAHRYVAAGDSDRGVAVFSPGHFEYEWTARRDLLLTLMRSVGELSKGDLPTRPGHAGWPMPTPEAQELGTHVIELAITPLGEAEADDIAALEALWEDTFLAPQGTFVRGFAGDLSGLTAIGAELSGAGLVFTAMKPAESGDGIVLRCYNVESGAVDGCWRFRHPIVRAVLLRADETPIRELAIEPSGSVRFEAPARGRVTILVWGSAGQRR